MKTKHFVLTILMIAFLLTGFETFAQRRVVNTPRRTVVQTPIGTVVYRKRPTLRTVKRLPRKAVIIHYHNNPYYYHGGVYYTSRNGVYIRIAPPIGIRVAVLPSDYLRLVIGPSVFFYVEGTFYVASETTSEYTVVAPPVGAIVYKLPESAAEIEINGKPFMECNGVIYKSVYVEKRAYEVVGTLEN
ncbi:MAG: DUF6515 family protein [Rikenellaceae bacterium]